MEPYLRNTIGDLIRRSARRFPARTALTFGERSWTYGELDAAAARVATGLRGLGLEPGDRVAAYGKNSDAYLLLFLGCARAGMVHVPINFGLAGDELAYIVEQSGSRALFFDPSLEDRVGAIRGRVGDVTLGTLRDGTGPHDALAWAATGSAEGGAAGDGEEEGTGPIDADLVQLLYTSGTTSAPKGAMLTHRALVHEYVSCIQALDLSGADRPLHALPLYHSAQMHVFLMPYLALGASNVVLEEPNPGAVLEHVERLRIDSFFAPPTFWIGLRSHPDFAARDLSSLRKAYYGASIMPVPVLQDLRAQLPGIGFYNCFGQSEIGPLATVLRPEDHDERPDSAGRPVLFVEARVVDEDMRDVPPGQMGEVVYRSPQLCLGYWQKPEETAEAFEGGWFHSGDLVVADEQGYLRVVDRKKDVINTGGVLVSSREVEEALYTHPAVKEVAVIALPDPRWIEAVTAVVVRREGALATEDELMAHVRGHLAAFKTPKRVLFVDDLPRNASGKLLKRVLRDDLGPNLSREP